MKYVCLIFILVGSLTKAQQVSNVLQNVMARDNTDLSGFWDISIDPLETGLYNHSGKERKTGYFINQKPKSSLDLIEYDFDASYQLNVPGDWNTQMEKLYYYEGTIWYKRSFSHDVNADKRAFIHFGAVNYQCKVYLNGKHLGDHEGGYTHFQFEITDLLEEDNFLILKVDNKRLGEGVPTLNTDWWNYGGITRKVTLVEVPHTYIADYLFRLNKEDKIEGWVQLDGKDKAGQNISIQLPELKKKVQLTTDDQGMASFEFAAKIQKWSPERPKLYDITIESSNNRVADQIGFKRIESRGSKILLNGQPIFLKGISIHEEAPFGGGRVTTLEQCKVLLNWAKELGCNFVRLAHYPHSEVMVREAEKMGFLIWSEIPVYWTIDYSNPSTYQIAEQQLLDMINRDKNRAAIGLWSVANETPITDPRMDFLKKLIDKARQTDPTRLIAAALDTQRGSAGETIIDDPLGKYIDVIGINSYCGWYSKKPQECVDIKWRNEFDKPMIMSEMGAGALQGLHGTYNERWTEEYQDEVYRCNIEMIQNIDFMAGMSPWILMDFRSPRRNLTRIQNDYNRKGLISENGIKKKAFFTLQDYYLSIKTHGKGESENIPKPVGNKP